MIFSAIRSFPNFVGLSLTTFVCSSLIYPHNQFGTQSLRRSFKFDTVWLIFDWVTAMTFNVSHNYSATSIVVSGDFVHPTTTLTQSFHNQMILLRRISFT